MIISPLLFCLLFYWPPLVSGLDCPWDTDDDYVNAKGNYCVRRVTIDTTSQVSNDVVTLTIVPDFAPIQSMSP